MLKTVILVIQDSEGGLSVVDCCPNGQESRGHFLISEDVGMYCQDCKEHFTSSTKEEKAKRLLLYHIRGF